MMAKNIEGRFICLVIALAIVVQIHPASSLPLSPNFYDTICPKALTTIRSVVFNALFFRQRDLGAALVRLHFHDCFVNGCDASVLLDDTPTFIGEKTANANINSLRGFEVIDEIKTAVDSVCNGNVVSCADILAVAARDSVDILGGGYYQVLVGRRDARNASLDDANASLPLPTFNRSQLVANFEAQGLNWTDLVDLSGAHTLGYAKCFRFRDRIYNDTNIDPAYKPYLQWLCPKIGGDNNTVALDGTPTYYDSWRYYQNLVLYRGLLHSDQELYKGDGSDMDDRVMQWRMPQILFNRNGTSVPFDPSLGPPMIKLGNIKPLNEEQGEIRKNCRRVN